MSETRLQTQLKAAESRERATYEDILGVLLLDSSNDSSGNHGLFPSLGKIEVVDSLLGALVNVIFHLLGHVLGSDVNLLDKRFVKQCSELIFAGRFVWLLPVKRVEGNLPQRRSC